jgi:16S rRNA U1498 N3-methylase RsmE
MEQTAQQCATAFIDEAQLHHIVAVMRCQYAGGFKEVTVKA